MTDSYVAKLLLAHGRNLLDEAHFAMMLHPNNEGETPVTIAMERGGYGIGAYDRHRIAKKAVPSIEKEGAAFPCIIFRSSDPIS